MRGFYPTIFSSPAFRLAAISFAINLATEASSVFMPLYAQDLGASNLQVGFIAATYGLAFFLASLFFGRQSDIHGRMGYVRAGLALSALAYLSQVFTRSPMLILAARGLVGFSLGITSAAIIAYTYENQKQIGGFASYGSLGWLFGALLAAAIRDYEALFITSAIISALAFLVSLSLREERVAPVQSAILPVSLLKANGRAYFSYLLRQIGANAIWAIFPLYLANIGASKVWIAVIDAINMGGQVVGMRLVQRFNPARVLQSGLALSVVVFAVYGVATSYVQLLPVQLLLALAWSGLYVGTLSYLLARNRERGAALGLFYSTTYLSSGVGPFLGGAMAQARGFGGVMFLGSALAFGGLLFSRGLNGRGSKTAGPH